MSLGKLSRERLAECHHELQQLVERAAAGVDAGDLAYVGVKDITVLCGYRGKDEQNDAVARGVSETPWPRSAHNRRPSDAVDVVPYPVDWSNTRQLDALHAYIAGIAHAMGIDLYDIDWDRPHIQRTGNR